MALITKFTCNICNQVSVVSISAKNKTLRVYGCNHEVHEMAEDAAPQAGNFSCQICNRKEIKLRNGGMYSGCNMFSSDRDQGIVGFHDLCFWQAVTKMPSNFKGLQIK